MQCSNPSCNGSAVFMPRLKRRAFRLSDDVAALADVGAPRVTVRNRALVRQRAMMKCGGLLQDLAVCDRDECIRWAASNTEGQGAVQMIAISPVLLEAISGKRGAGRG